MTKKTLKSLFDAMYHGKFDFNDFLNAPMSEYYDALQLNSSKGRRILRPKPKLKVYHTFLNLFVFEQLPLNEKVVFSYRKGFNASNAVEVHAGSKYFYQTDIRSFFDSIDSELVRSTIIQGVSGSPVEDLEIHLDRIIQLVCVGETLPVGFPSSAPLSNAVLYRFDDSLEQYCSSLNVRYTRYADDIIISGASKDALVDLSAEIQARLDSFASPKLRLNPKKTKYFQVGNKVKILGMMILPNGKVTPDTKKKRELEVLLHFYLNDKEKFSSMVGGEEQEGVDRLAGNLNYVDSIDPDYTNKLRRKFGATTIDILLHRGFSQ
jgi:RNA-directed DNA polymerase